MSLRIEKKYLVILLAMVLSCLTLESQAELGKEEIENWPVIKEASELENKGHYRAALKFYQHAYKNGMGRALVIPQIVECYIKLDKRDNALEFLVDAAKDNPFDADTRLLLSDVYLQNGQDTLAIAELEYVDKLNAKDFLATYKRGLIYKKQGNHETAIPLFNLFIENTKPTSFEPYLNRAQSHFALGKADLAEKDLKKAYDIKQLHQETLLTYIKVLQALRKFAEAEPLARQCSDLNSQSVVCWDLRADVAVALKKCSNAIEYFLSALKIAPRDFVIRTKLAGMYLHTKQTTDADAQYDRVLKINPGHLVAIKEWIPELLGRKDFKKAAKVFEAFHNHNPENLWAALEYAKLMDFVGSHDIAANVMKATVKASKTDLSRLFYAYYLFHNADHDKAEDELTDIKDQELPVGFNLGIVYWKMNKFDKAIAAWSRVQNESPYWGKAQLNIAMALERKGKVSDAIERLSALPAEMRNKFSEYLGHLDKTMERTAASDTKPNAKFDIFSEWELPTL